MNFNGVLTAFCCFFCMGLFHPIVIKSEYYFGVKCWPVFLVGGLILLALSVVTQQILLSVVLGAAGCCFLWSILELFEQRKRVRKGWFPANPNRKE